MHTGKRNQLHLNQVEQFADWAETQGYKRESTKGDYEILRLRKNGNIEPPLILWTHIGGDHATTDKRSQLLVTIWLHDKNNRVNTTGGMDDD